VDKEDSDLEDNPDYLEKFNHYPVALERIDDEVKHGYDSDSCPDEWLCSEDDLLGLKSTRLDTDLAGGSCHDLYQGCSLVCALQLGKQKPTHKLEMIARATEA